MKNLMMVAGGITGAALLLCLPMLAHDHLPLGSDVYVTHHYLRGFYDALREGEIFPRWIAATNQGMGAPVFVYYPPLPWYGASLAWLCTGSIDGAFRLYFAVLALLTGASFYALARQWAGPGIPSALAAALYLTLPYHALDMYHRFALSETTAFLFLPLILLYARRAIVAGRVSDHLLLALSWAGLLYTHIVSAIPFAMLLAPWILWQVWGRWGSLARVAATLLAGTLLAAPILLPVALERGLMNTAWFLEMPNGDFRLNFLFRDGILPGLGIRDPVKPPVFRAAHAQLLLAIVAAGLAWTWTATAQTRRRKDILVLAAGAVGAYLIQTPLSTPVWLLLPVLRSIQFPWRFQVEMVLSASLLAAFAMSSGWGRAGGATASRRGIVSAGGILLVAAILVNLLLAIQNTGLKQFEYTAEMDSHPVVEGWIEPAFTPREYRAYRRLKETRVDIPRASFVQGEGTAEVSTWASSSRRIILDSATGGTVRIRTFWFPGWVGRLDGKPLPLAPDASLAAISFRVEPGRHEVELVFSDTAVRRAGVWIGRGSCLLVPILAFLLRRRRS